MTALLDVTILGEPVGQGRPRAVRMGPHVRMHSAPKSANWQAIAAQQIAAAWDRDAFDEEGNAATAVAYGQPVRLVLVAVGPRPKSVPKRQGRGRYWRTTKPDLDNVVKAAGDALVQAGVLRDDTLVVEIQARNEVAADGEAPHVRIRVEPVSAMECVPWPPKARISEAAPRLGLLPGQR